MGFHQPKPHKVCRSRGVQRLGSRCRNHKCSLTCRVAWAHRESVILARQLSELANSGMYVLCGTTNPLADADAGQVASARRLILNGLKGLPGVVRLYSVSEIARNLRLHDHWVMTSDCKLAISRVKAVIRQSWRAVGVKTRTKVEVPRDFTAISNYMHKNLRAVREGKRFVRLFAKGTVDMVWGTCGPRAFFLKGDKARHWLAYRTECFDPARVRPRLRVVRVAG